MTKKSANILADLRDARENQQAAPATQNLSIEQEIEGPRFYDVMTLQSEFDRLEYFCEECSFSLHLSH